MQEFETWIHDKVTSSDSNNKWAFIASTPDVVKYAYHFAARRHPNVTLFPNQRIVTLSDFRDLLIHLFAVSILWVHFKNADDWEEGRDKGNLELNFEEFKLACHTITAAYGKESLNDEQLQQDFVAIDKDGSKSLDFFEVCEHCCRLLQSQKQRFEYDKFDEFVFHKRAMSSKTNLAIIEGVSNKTHSTPSASVKTQSEFNELECLRHSIFRDLHADCSTKFKHLLDSSEAKTDNAIEFLHAQYHKNKGIAEFVEVKFNTELEITRMLYGEAGEMPQC